MRIIHLLYIFSITGCSSQDLDDSKLKYFKHNGEFVSVSIPILDSLSFILIDPQHGSSSDSYIYEDTLHKYIIFISPNHSAAFKRHTIQNEIKVEHFLQQ